MSYYGHSLTLLCRFNGALSVELTNDHPHMRIIHRKVALILGQWVSEVFDSGLFVRVINLHCNLSKLLLGFSALSVMASLV